MEGILNKDDLLDALMMAGIDEVQVGQLGDRMTYLEKKEGVPKFGYGFEIIKCGECGYVGTSIHPLPMKYPCECGRCGKMACYVHEPRRNDGQAGGSDKAE